VSAAKQSISLSWATWIASSQGLLAMTGSEHQSTVSLTGLPTRQPCILSVLHRHCERREAIHLAASQGAGIFVAIAPRNDRYGAYVNFRRPRGHRLPGGERLMGTNPAARFAFISDKAEFASEDLLDV
jgi:hypothetical protein